MLEREKVGEWVVCWFEKNTMIKKNEIVSNLQQNYFDNNLIDSFRFISFIMDIEQHFNINFSNDEFQNREFSTINGISEIIYKRISDEKV